jgi:membrane protease YdiL (CAAX protease family)
MNAYGENARTVSPQMPASDAPTGGGKAVQPLGWVRTTLMTVGFVVVMLVSNSIATSLENPLAALLIGPLLAVLILWLYRSVARRLEHRDATDLDRRRARSQLTMGAAGGFLLGAVTIGVLALFGGYEITGWGSLAGTLTVIGMMCAIAVAEEVLFRGVIFRLLQNRWGSWLALSVSAVLFGLVHLINPGATLWGAAAIVIEAGLMLGAAYLVTGSLWLPIGLHLGWNVTIVALFGTVASGSGTHDALVTSVTHGPDWLTGGSFGPEASVIAVVVCSVATTALLLIARRRGRILAAR